MSHQSLILAAQIANAVTTEPSLDGWMYLAIHDDKLCDTCLEYETQLVFSDEEVEEEFPDSRVISNNEIYPNVHMTLWGRDSQCRCRLFRYREVGGDGDLPKGPISDEKFDDWLSGLLAAGYITAAIYDKIVARRKKQKQETKK